MSENIKFKKELIEKYADVLGAISRANEVDLGVAFDMLKANACDNCTYPVVKVEEFKADIEKLQSLSK